MGVKEIMESSQRGVYEKVEDMAAAARIAVSSTVLYEAGRQIMLFQTAELRQEVEKFLGECLTRNEANYKRCLYVLALESEPEMLRGVGEGVFHVFRDAGQPTAPVLWKNVISPLLARNGNSLVVYRLANK